MIYVALTAPILALGVLLLLQRIERSVVARDPRREERGRRRSRRNGSAETPDDTE
jgi:hypothetical protein